MDDGSWGYAYQRSRKRTPLIRSFFHGKGFPGGLDGKASARNAEDLGSIPGLERSPGGRHGNPLLAYSCLENPMDRGAWQATWGCRVRCN